MDDHHTEIRGYQTLLEDARVERDRLRAELAECDRLRAKLREELDVTRNHGKRQASEMMGKIRGQRQEIKARLQQTERLTTELQEADRALVALMDAQGLSTDSRRYVVRHVAPTVADAREREAARKVKLKTP